MTTEPTIMITAEHYDRLMRAVEDRGRLKGAIHVVLDTTRVIPFSSIRAILQDALDQVEGTP